MVALLDAVVDLLAPPRCLACRRRGPLPWCDHCAAAADALALVEPCNLCAAPTDGPGHHCWLGSPPVDRLLAGYRYEGPVSAAVVSAKLGGGWAGWRPLGRRLARAVGDFPLDVHAVTWVPTEPRRCRRRGFDHAQLLAEGLADGLGLPTFATMQARSGSPDQGSRPPASRARPLDGAFTPARAVGGARLALVDDVVTTGATLAAAAGTLRRAGVAQLVGVVLARAGGHPLVSVTGR